MASDCTANQQAFAGAYVLLSCVFLFSVLYESCKLLYRYQNPDYSFKSPKYLLFMSMLFVFISIISLIKCILYGVWRCDSASLHPYNMSIVQSLSQDLYVIQLYILWLVLLMRLYYTFKETPFQLTKLTIQMYSVCFLLIPFTCFLWISPDTYSLFIPISYSLSIFITLSIVILFCYKLVQLNRYREWHLSKQYTEYTQAHGLDLLTLITKHSVLVLIATMFSFAILLILITIFVLNVYDVSLIGQQQLLDLCLLFDTYITTVCVLFMFVYLHRKYEFCCSCVDVTCKSMCRKYFGVSLNISQEIQLTNIMEEKDAELLRAPRALSNQGSHSSYHQAINSSSINISPQNAQHHIMHPKQVPSYEIESERGSNIPDIPENQTIDDMLRKLHAIEHAKQRAAHPQHYKQQTIPRNIYTNITAKSIQQILIKRGFHKMFTQRAVALYQKHYGSKRYDILIIEEILYRLAIKDKLKQLKAEKNLYASRQDVLNVLSSLNFSLRYINLATLLYEVMAEMFEIGKQNESIYDLELITELIMRLRAKFTEYGDILQSGVYINCEADGGTLADTKTLDTTEVEYKGHFPQRTNSGEYRGHHPQQTTETDLTNRQFVDIVNHRIMSMSPDGYIRTQIEMNNAPTLSMDAVSAAAPSSTNGGVDDYEDEEEEEDTELMDAEVHYNTNDIDGESPEHQHYHVKVSSGIHEAESIEIDATPLANPNSNQSNLFSVGAKSSTRVLDTIQEQHRRPKAPKHKDYNVIIDFINTPNGRRAASQNSSTGEPIRMEESDSDDMDTDEEYDDYEDEEEKEAFETLHEDNGGRGKRLNAIESDDRGNKHRHHASQASWITQQSFFTRMKSLAVLSPPESMTDYDTRYKNANVKAKIENEIIETERTYLEGLHILYDEFIVPIFEQKLLHERYRKQVTSIIPQLIAFHEQFYAQLQEQSIVEVFNQQSDFLKMYISYVSQYKKILDVFGNTQKNKKLHRFVEHKRLNENKTLVSFLILPIQRIPRYMLLLSELKKKTSKHRGFEYRDIDKALKRVELICDGINEKERVIENMSQALLVSNKLKGLTVNIVEPQRKYIDHFVFCLKKKKKNQHFFVFSDIVIIADMKWRIQQVIELVNFEAKRPKQNEIKIRIIEDTGSPMPASGSPITPLGGNAPITYCATDDIAPDDRHEHVSDAGIFCKTVNKYRAKLRSYVQVSPYASATASKQTSIIHMSKQKTDSDEIVFREEHEKEEFAKWQKSHSKGNKAKVAKMLKPSSKNVFYD